MNAWKTNDRLLRKWSERTRKCGILWDTCGITYIQHKTTNAKTERLNRNASSIRQHVIVNVCLRSAFAVAYLTGMKLSHDALAIVFTVHGKKCMQNQAHQCFNWLTHRLSQTRTGFHVKSTRARYVLVSLCLYPLDSHRQWINGR